MDIQELSLSAISRYGNNPRNNAAAVEKVAASIREFGWRQPIVVDDSMVIIAGDTRFQAAQLLGLATVPVHIARGLSPEQVRAYRLADNKTGEFASWDDARLADELAALMDGLGDIELTGFSMGEFEALAMKAEAEVAALLEDDHPAPGDDVAGEAGADAGELPAQDAPTDEPAQPDPGQPAAMVPFNLLMQVEHRQTVFDAINHAKQAHGVETTAEALFVICQEYMSNG